MKFVFVCLAAASLLTPAFAQQASQGPSNEKAQKSYKQAFQELREGQEAFALDEFKKADKQDGGHCFACQAQMIKYGCKLGDWNTAELAGEEMVAEAKDDKESALAHYQLAYVLPAEAYQNHQSELWTRAHNELVKALNAYSAFSDELFLDGRALANLNQDDATKARFQELL
jgi:hypothetical protein